MKYLNAVERCYQRCKSIGRKVDIWKQMMRYKVLREAPEVIQEATYISIASKLGIISGFWKEV